MKTYISQVSIHCNWVTVNNLRKRILNGFIFYQSCLSKYTFSPQSFQIVHFLALCLVLLRASLSPYIPDSTLHSLIFIFFWSALSSPCFSDSALSSPTSIFFPLSGPFSPYPSDSVFSNLSLYLISY